MVRTLGFHPKNRSSILLRSTMEKLIILSTAILIAFAGMSKNNLDMLIEELKTIFKKRIDYEY